MAERRACFALALIAMMATILTTSAAAQVEQASFVGRITDPSGAAVNGAKVIATNVETNIVYRAVTNSTGDYVITPIPPGSYVLDVNATGFQRTTTKAIEVQVGQIAREDLPVSIGTATTEVRVTTAAPLLSTDSATMNQVITNRQVLDLPLNGRGYYQLAELTPGTALLGATGNSLAIRPEIVNGNVISGIRGRAISFLMDGVDVSEQHQGGTFIQTSIDALQEFSVVQSPYSAEYNRGGAFFNATIKAGTNHYHGGAFDFLRNDDMDARNYFSLKRQVLKRNQFGADLGGPVTIPHLYSGKDRTFFFFSYEGQRLDQGLVFNGIVPSDAERAGNFGSKPIYDPLSSVTIGNSTQRTEFPNNTIPANRLSSQALAIMSYYPAQNTSTGTFSAVPPQTINFNQYIVRLDDQLTPNNRLFAHWVYMTQHEVDPNFSPALGRANLTSIGQDIAVGLTTNFGATMINEARAHYLPSHVRLQAFLEGPDFNQQFGVAGFNGLLRSGSGSFPDYAWSGYASLQGSAFDERPKSQDRKAVEFSDNFTKLYGRQSIKAGVLIRYYQWLGFDSEQYAGQFDFNGNETAQVTQTTNGGTSTTTASGGDAFADFLLGDPSSVQRAYPAANFGGQGWSKQFYVQDDFRASDKLTLTGGLRYEYTPWLSGYLGQVGTFNPALAKPIIDSGSGATPNLAAQPSAPAAYQFFGQYIQTSSEAGLPANITYTDKLQFGPRIGLSYSLDNKTVVRAGFGVFYEPENTDGRLNLNMLPFRLNETQNQTQNAAPARTLANFFLGAPLGSAQANPSLVPTKTHMSMGRNAHYSLDVQRQFTDHDMVDVGYVGNRSIHLNATNDFNDPSPGPGSVQARRPYQPWSNITFDTQDESSNYNALQAKYDHRFNHGYNLLVSYSWSKWLQYNQSPAVGGNTGYEYALSPWDIPQNLAISGIYLLPFGRGRTLLSHANALTDGVLGGWQLQTILDLRSGIPYTPTVSGDRANTGVGSQRPNINARGCSSGFHRSLATWFNESCYVDGPVYTYGQVRAESLRSDVYRQYDASIFKNFAMPGESTLSFRAEFFNLSNTTTFAPPSGTVDVASGARVTATSNTPREIQLALKYNF
ncbi:MAG TPA: TonB-dependent receptor [Acidobacteriaceae bacterium]|jgi:hypothetical protein|nr:TonB-dependent receptor [Acidobacteriaceae bacterium]